MDNNILQKIVVIFQEFLLEPILLAFGIFVIFPHWQQIYNDTIFGLKINIPVLVNALWEDMQMSPAPYIIFAIFFLIWVGLKAYRLKVESKYQKNMADILTRLTDVLDKMSKEK